MRLERNTNEGSTVSLIFFSKFELNEKMQIRYLVQCLA